MDTCVDTSESSNIKKTSVIETNWMKFISTWARCNYGKNVFSGFHTVNFVNYSYPTDACNSKIWWEDFFGSFV